MLWILCWIILWWVENCYADAPQIKDVRGCYGSNIQVTCPRDHVINILHDYYGLSDQPCNQAEVLCSVPTIFHRSQVRRHCNGHQSCKYKINQRNECSYHGKLNFTNFLHVDYECIPEKSVKNLCETKSWTVKSGYLSSPLYPQMYPKGLNCGCRLFTNNTKGTIGVQTLEFHLADETSCVDWLYVITDFSSEQLCGTLARHFVGRELSLLLHTENDGFKGFMLHFEALEDSSLVSVVCDSVDPKEDSERSIANFHEKLDSQDDISGYFRSLASDKRLITTNENSKSKLKEDKNNERVLQRTKFQSNRPMVRSMPVKLFGEQILPKKQPHKYRPTVHTISACVGHVLDFKCEHASDVMRVIDEFYGRAGSGRCKYRRGDCIVRAKAGTRVAQRSCQGRSVCSDVIVTQMPCKPSRTNYMEVIYECVPERAVYNMAESFTMQAPFGYLSTPGFPNEYPHNTNASCLVRATTNSKQVEVSVVHLSLPLGDECSDSVDIIRDKAVTRLCNVVNQKTVQGRFRSRAIMIVFNSDSTGTAPGVWLHFRGLGRSDANVQCSGTKAESASKTVEVSGKVLHIDRNQGKVQIGQKQKNKSPVTLENKATIPPAVFWIDELVRSNKPTLSPKVNEISPETQEIHTTTTKPEMVEEDSESVAIDFEEEFHEEFEILSNGEDFIGSDYLPVDANFIPSGTQLEGTSRDFQMPAINFQLPPGVDIDEPLNKLSLDLDYSDDVTQVNDMERTTRSSGADRATCSLNSKHVIVGVFGFNIFFIRLFL